MTMSEINLPHLTKFKNNSLIILIIIFIGYGILIFFLYQYYQDKVEVKKSQILYDNYNKITQVSINKITSLLQHLSGSLENKDFSISSNTRDIEICLDKCINYNVFRFGALIDQCVPDFIHYRIELNKKFLYANFKEQNYQIEKIYHINSRNQFSISVSIDDIFWEKIKAEIKEPVLLVTLAFGVNALLLYILYKLSIKYLNKAYASDYQDNYRKELDRLKYEQQQELKNCKASLMNKIWNLNFSKQKDLEINCLFAMEANKIALINESFDSNQENVIKNCRLENSDDQVPCSIILYQQDKIDEINVTQLIDLLNDRFEQEDENITIKITSRVKEVYFASKASLYQIIYSLISYLIFMINKQSPTAKHNIRLVIDNIGRLVQLRFEYDGFPIREEKELLKMSNYFFKTHANPFLLNVTQVFNTLRINGFDCNVSHDRLNVIDIFKKKQIDNQKMTTQNNVIFLSPFIEKK
jgi:hypothetical protein